MDASPVYTTSGETEFDRDQERALLIRCAAGDTAAFNPVIRAYADRAYYYALSILHNLHDALEASQESFIKAFRAISGYDPERAFFPWFLAILRHRCLDVLRKRGRRPDMPGPLDPDDVLRFVAGSEPRPDRVSANQDEVRRIQNAMQRLAPDHREVMHLRHFEDLSYAEIAELLDIPQGTVMSRLYHARRNLAKLMNSG